MVTSMMTQVYRPISFWGDALLIATYIFNRVPSNVLFPHIINYGQEDDLNLVI